MKHDPRVGKGVALALGATGEDHSGGRGGHAHADRAHVRSDVLHRVVDGEQRRDRATRRVDVEEYVFIRVVRLEMQQLGHDQVGDRVIDRRAQEDDAVLEEPAVDIEVALPTARLFEDCGNHVVVSIHSSSSTTSAMTTSASTASSATTSASTSGTSKLRLTGFPSSSTGVALVRMASSALFRRISLASANS